LQPLGRYFYLTVCITRVIKGGGGPGDFCNHTYNRDQMVLKIILEH
jgi:hypothetical protein